MSVALRILLISVSVLTTIYILKKIRQSKLQIEYAIFWVIFAGLLIILSVFPQIVYWCADITGITSPANFIFVFVIFLLLLKLFLVTIELSQLENKVKELTQEIALNKKESAGKKIDTDKPNKYVEK